MTTIGRKVANLERRRPPVGCPRCDGKLIGVIFRNPAPGDYEAGPDGREPPIPPACPRCGRRIPKTYLLQDRATWDSIVG